MAESPRIQFRAMPPLDKAIEERTPLYGEEGLLPVGQKSSLLSETARRDLDRYYDLLKRSLPRFSMGEAMLLMDVFNGTIHMPYSVSLLWASVDDALPDGYAQKWEIDGPTLVEKLRKLTPFECMAVADALERAWNNPTYYVETGTLEEKLKVVGLVKE